MRRLTPFFLGLAVICLAGMTYLLVRRNAELRALETRLAEISDQSKKQVADLQRRLDGAEKARADSDQLYQKMKAGAEAAGRAAAEGSAAARNSAAPGGLMDQMRKDPAYAALWRKQQLRNVQREYGDAIAALHLAPDQAAKLRDLLVARNDARLDAREEGQQQGLTGRDLMQATTQATDAVTEEIKAEIGDDNYQKLDQAPKVGVFKMMINSTVGTDLEAAGVPLNSDQEAAVAQGLSAMMRGGGATFGQTPDPATGLTPAAQAVLDKMSPSVSREQVPIVKDYLAEQIMQQAYFRAHPPARR